jgi:hypothetical protein
MTPDPDYHFEAEMAGFYAGGVMGGLFFGVVGDLFRSHTHSMLWYITGTVLGAIVGAAAGFLFRRLPPDEPSDAEVT